MHATGQDTEDSQIFVQHNLVCQLLVVAICAWPRSGVPGGNKPKGELPGLDIEMLIGL